MVSGLSLSLSLLLLSATTLGLVIQRKHKWLVFVFNCLIVFEL